MRIQPLALLTVGALLVASACSTGAASSGDGTMGSATANATTASNAKPEVTSKGSSAAQVKHPPVTSSSAEARPSVTGKLLRAPLPDGYESVGADDPDAKEALDSGGVVVREKGKKGGAVMGASAMPGLPVDPADKEICSKGSDATAQGNGTTLKSAEIATVGGRPVCRAEFTKTGTHLVSQSFTWLADSSSKLGVMVVCAMDSDNAEAARACQEFASAVVPAK